MSLLTVLRSGVAMADKITKPLQSTVMYEQSTGNDGYGTLLFAAAVSLHAIVDYTSKQVRTKEGVLTVTRATIELLNIAEIVAATNGEGIGNNDRFTLQDGDTGPILDIGGFVDAGTGNPISTKVSLG